MKNQRLLYLVQHSNKEMFKIGIGTDNGRFQSLDRDYSIDWTSSIYFKGENQDIIKMEKILHRLFYEYRLDKQNGTGGTEWFSSECLKSTVEAVLFNVDNSGFSIDLQPHEIILSECNTENVDLQIGDKNKKELNLLLGWNQQKQRIFSKYPQSIIDKWTKLDNLEPTPKIVDEMNRLIPEFHCFLKPSELSQVLFVKGTDIDDVNIIKITPGQIDLINCIYYMTRENIIKNNLEIAEKGSTTFNILLKDISTNIEKYNNYQYEKIINDLSAISDIKIVINSLGKNKDETVSLLTRFILEIEFSRHRKNLHKKTVSLMLSNRLIHKFINVKKYFAKMFFKIQFSFSSKYSKLLYELLKDYENIKSFTISLIKLVQLLNDTNYKEWSIFRANVLKRAISEINEKSDIIVSYEPIKEKLPDQRKQVTKIKFNIKKQSEQQLIKLGLIEESITSLPFYNKSKSKLDKLIKNGYKVVDEDMWIQTDIKKNEDRYDAEVRIDTWLKETEKDDKNKLYEILADNLDNCEDPMVIIEDYRIIGLFTKDLFTKSAQETLDKLNWIIDELKPQE